MRLSIARATVLGALLVFSSLGFTAGSALATTAEEINVLPTVDALNRTENPLSNSGKWSLLTWALNTGQDTATGWGPVSTSIVNGAYWNPSLLSDKTGNSAAITMPTLPGTAGNYVSLWLDMSSPGSARTGYQLRWTVTSGSTFAVSLSKWSSGTETVLASKSSVTIAAGSTMAISDTGGTVTAWQAASGGALTSLLSASDTTFTSGYAGIDGSGNASRLVNFKAGLLLGGAIAGVPVLDNLERNEFPLATGKWSKTSWAGELGGAWCCGTYRGYGSSGSSLASTYWNSKSFSDAGGGDLVAATVGSGSTPAGQYLAQWLNVPNPGSARSGYEARFEGVNGSSTNYKVTLSKWVSGTRTVLGTKEGFSLPVGTTMALTEVGGSLVLWTGTSSFTPLLAATDSTYTSGYAGLEVSGSTGTEYNFRAGSIVQSVDTTISDGPSGTVTASSVLFTFTASVAGASFECLLDAGAYGGCTSPKTYSPIQPGAHLFRVRAVDGSGPDATPAERSFSVTQLPGVSNTAATAIKSTQATLGAEVNPNYSSTTYQFEYGTTTSYGTKVPVTTKNIGSGTANVAVSEPIAGLTAGTTYHFRISATNAAGTTKGADQVFTTTAAPAVTTEAAINVSASEATLKAAVYPKGAATTYYFEYGPTTSYGTKVPASPKSAGSGSSPVAISEPIAGLVEGNVYHFRVVATNEVGTVQGSDVTLTAPYRPEVETQAAEVINANETILKGSVDPNGSETTYQFEYGQTTGYGNVTPEGEEEVGFVSDPTTTIEVAEGLEPETTYHYRVIAKSAAGTRVGQDKSFTTSAGVSAAQREEQEEDEEEAEATASGSLPPEFMGLVWSGSGVKTANLHTLIVTKHSGAKMFRLGNFQLWTEGQLENIVQWAADRDITILPNLGAGWRNPDPNFWNSYLEHLVEKYGPNGTYWASNGGGADKPMRAWEIGNEPNLGSNARGHVSGFDEFTKSQIENYGDIFARDAEAARKGAKNRNTEIEVILAALFTTGPTGCKKTSEGTKECNAEAAEFIETMGHNSSYDAVAVHPYVFKVGKPLGPINSGEDVTRAAKKVARNIRKVRKALQNESENNKSIWITEIGFPTKTQNSTAFPSVNEDVQGKLVTATFSKIKARRGANDLGISHLFYYNIQDWPEEYPRWEYSDGLRDGNGKRRPSWTAYALQAGGDPNWPGGTAHSSTTRKNLRATSVVLDSTLNTEGAEVTAHFQYWQPAPDPIVRESAPGGTLTTEQDQEFEQKVSLGVQPSTEYVFHSVATNEQGVTTVGPNGTFNTPPSSSTSTNVKRVLHGQPGWVWVDGWVKEGYIDGPESGPGLSNVHVHIKLFRNGQFQRFEDVMTNGEGHYDSGYMVTGKGDWEVASEFPGGGEWDASETSPRKTFTVKDGVRIRAKHSDKCMDIFGAYSNNGAAVMHGECNEPPSANQVFTLAPVGDGQYLQIIARNSGKCVDVDNASAADGAGLQQYDCLGANQANQLFREAWWGETPYTSYVAKHSQKCLDVTGANQGWTNMQQWTCNEGFQQRFRLEPVESGPIGTETFFTTDHVIHGNGQYGNWGLIGFHGNLKAGAYSMENRVVQIEFEKLVGGNYVRTDNMPLTVNWEGAYRFGDYGLAPGTWRVRAHFMGNSEFGESASAWHDFSIFQANRLVARHSDKCLTLSENKNVNGQQLIQWECVGTGAMQDGQSFWFWPLGNNIYNITVISSGKCLDIRDGSTANGALLQQWDCNGFGQQKWELLPIAGQDGWYALRPQHSNKCLDVFGAQTGNGATVWQWDCHWGPNQQWKIVGVVGG